MDNEIMKAKCFNSTLLFRKLRKSAFGIKNLYC